MNENAQIVREQKHIQRNSEGKAFEVRGLIECKICKKTFWSKWRKAAKVGEVFEPLDQVEANILMGSQNQHYDCLTKNSGGPTLYFLKIEKR